MSTPPPSVMQCYLVNSVSIDPLEQCKFLIDNNCLDKESFIDYAYLIYCRIGYDFRLLSTVMIVFLVILFFLAISAIADDFLCTSLLTVSRNLSMSDSLAGITLLAFGNGCPDIFSSIAAACDSRSEMIIGELLGAGIFCTSVVSGLVFINSDFKLACRPILRDTSIYILAVYLIWCYSYSGQITFYGALTFIIIYLVYLTVAVCGQVLSSRLRGNYAIEQQHQQQQGQFTTNVVKELLGYALEDESGTWFRRREESLKKRRSSGSLAKGSVAAPQPPARPIIRIDGNEGVTSVHLGSRDACSQPAHLKHASRAPLEIQLFSSLKTGPATTGKPPAGCFTNEAFVAGEHRTAPHTNHLDKSKSPPPPQVERPRQEPAQLSAAGCQKPEPSSYQVQQHRILSQPPQQPIPGNNKEPAGMQQQLDAIGGGGGDGCASEWDSFLAHINPIETTDWATISPTARIIRILQAPTILLGQLTIPIVDNQKILNNWCRPLNALHFITVPLFIMLTTGLLLGSDDGESEGSEEGGGSSPSSSSWAVDCSLSSLVGVPTPVAELVVATVLAAYLFHRTSPHKAPKYHAAFAYVGFGMSVFWVYLVASEMISLMKTIGLVFGMSDTSIGLGILAWGNSLGDIVANYSLTKANYPRMALGACIGAPLLNLLLGFGLSFTISLRPGQYSAIQYSPTITLLCSTLAIILLSLMLTTLLPPNTSKRPIGYLLIAGYLVYFMAAVCLEYKLINF